MAHTKAKRAGQVDQGRAGQNIVPLFQVPARGSGRATGTRLSGLDGLPRVELAGRPGPSHGTGLLASPLSESN